MYKRMKRGDRLKLLNSYSTKPKTKLGTFLNELRLSENESMEDLAEHLGYSYARIYHILHKDLDFNTKIYLQILDNYDLNSDQLTTLKNIFDENKEEKIKEWENEWNKELELFLKRKNENNV